jgi:hypothetical protein
MNIARKWVVSPNAGMRAIRLQRLHFTAPAKPELW